MLSEKLSEKTSSVEELNGGAKPDGTRLSSESFDLCSCVKSCYYGCLRGTGWEMPDPWYLVCRDVLNPGNGGSRLSHLLGLKNADGG